MKKEEVLDCLILGGGPAGMSSALYCARAGLDCAILDTYTLGGSPVNYLEIENYLGFQKTTGSALAQAFEKHISNFDIKKFEFSQILNVDIKNKIKCINTSEKNMYAKSIIIATGAKPKKLGVKGEEENIGKGVSYCAVCDGAFYKDKCAAVVGGGNSALEEADYLTRFCSKVFLIHRREEFRADKIIQDRILNNKKIELVLNCTVKEILSDNKVRKVVLCDTKTNKTNELDIDGIFPYIGIEANSEMFKGQIEIDSNGFIITDNTMKTTTQGVFAVGDVRNTPLRQVITAVSDGAIAGVEASKYISTFNKEKANESISLR